MTRYANNMNRWLGLLGTVVILCAAGCKEEIAGPKRDDHDAAHTARYHPEVRRSDADTSSTSDITTTQPALTSRPADPFAGPGPVGSPVLFVNGDTLTVQEILEPLTADLNRQASILTPIGYRDYLFRTITNQIRSQVSLIVVYQQAKDTYPEEAHKAVDARADEMIRDVIDRRFGGVNARYEEHLQVLDLTLDDMKKRARRQVLVTQFLQDRFLPRLREPSRRELMKYYQTHQDEFTTPARAELFLIEVPIEKELGNSIAPESKEVLAAAREQARARVDRARQELESGVDFAAVAKRYSKGDRALVGGDWGEISPNTLTGRWATYSEVLFTLDAGQIGDVLDLEEAVGLVKCGKRTAQHRVSFEGAQEQIVVRVKDEQYKRMTDSYVVELLEQATIDERQKQGLFLAAVAAAPLPANFPPAGQAKKEQ